MHCLIKMEIAAQDGRLRHGAELEQEAGDSFYFLLVPDLTAESAIPVSVKRTNTDYMNWIRPPISIASETPKFTLMPPDAQP